MSNSATEEQYFPRGRLPTAGPSSERTAADAATPSTSGTRQENRRRPAKDLFGVLDSSKKKPKKVPQSDEEEDFEEDSIVIDPLTHKNIQVGMIVLGAVHNIHGSMCRIALPGCYATLDGHAYSHSYSNLYNKWAKLEPDRDNPSNLPRLASRDTIFKVGQMLKFCVRSVGRKSSIQVSAIPEEVNARMSPERLCDGMIIQAAIASREEYGYALETGIIGLKAFIRAEAFETPMHIGQVLLVKVTDDKKLSKRRYEPYCFENVVGDLNKWGFIDILPGTIVNAKVIEKTNDGLGLWIGETETATFMGAVEPRQMRPDIDPEIGDMVPAVILFKHPFLDILNCSLKIPPISPSAPFAPFCGLVLGQLIKMAVVVRVTSGFVELKIPVKKKKANVSAIAARDNVSDDDTKLPTDLYQEGQIVTCRIIGFALLEGQAYVSLRESVVEEGLFYTEDELIVGKIFNAKVKHTTERGIVFEMCPGVTGFCDFTEASPIASVSNVEDLYPAGKPVRIMIRYINGNYYPSRYFVTCNKSILSSQKPIITSYEEARIGQVTDGIILQVKKTGILVGFFNKVRGWAPEHQLPYSTKEIDASYTVGQVVAVRVCNVNKEAKRMTISLRLALQNVALAAKSKLRDQVSEEPDSPDMIPSPDDSIFYGGIKVVVLEIGNDHIRFVSNVGDECCMPREHLSDFSDLSKVLFDTVSVGQTLRDLTYFGESGGSTILTMKHSICDMAARRVMQATEYGVVTGGPVKRSGPWGVLIELPFGDLCMIPLKSLSDSFIPADSVKVPEGQTLICKITQCRDGDIRGTCKKSEIPYELEDCTRKSLIKTLTLLNKMKVSDHIGEVIKVTPRSVGHYINCEYGAKTAIACRNLTTECQSVRVEPTNAIILGYQYNEKDEMILVVTIDRELVYRYIQARQKSRDRHQFRGATKTVMQVLVVAVLRDYAASMTKDGRLILLPLGAHLSDLRRGRWLDDTHTDHLPRTVNAYVQEMVYEGVGVGNFVKSEGVTPVETQLVSKITSPEYTASSSPHSEASDAFLPSDVDSDENVAMDSDDAASHWDSTDERDIRRDNVRQQNDDESDTSASTGEDDENSEPDLDPANQRIIPIVRRR